MFILGRLHSINLGFPIFHFNIACVWTRPKAIVISQMSRTHLILVSKLHCFHPLPARFFERGVKRSFSASEGRLPPISRNNALRLADCSLRDHIKRFGKCHCFLYCCCCCVFPLPNNGLPGQSPLTGCQIPAYRVFNSHPASAIFLSPSGPGPLPQPGSIVWSQAARAGPRLAQTYSLHSLEDCQ